MDATWKADGTVLPEAEEALHRALEEYRVVLTVQQGREIAMSADGTRFATTGKHGTPTVWETDTGTPLFTLRGHEGEVNGIAFSPDGSLLASTGSDRTVRLWDGASGRPIHVLGGHRKLVLGVAFSPDGKLLATSSTGRHRSDLGRRGGHPAPRAEGPSRREVPRTFTFRPHPRLQPRRVQGDERRVVQHADLGPGDGEDRR